MKSWTNQYPNRKLTKIQTEVQRLHDTHYTEISDSLRKWAEQTAIKKLAPIAVRYSLKSHDMWCPICGEVIREGEYTIGDESKCPHCHNSIRASKYIDTQDKGCLTTRDWFFLEEITTCGAWQIDRVYLADYKFRKGHKAQLNDLFVVYERWFDPIRHKKVMLGKYVGMFPYMRYIPYAHSFYADCEVYVHKTEGNGTIHARIDPYSYYCEDRYHTSADTPLYPRKRLLPYYERCDIMGMREDAIRNNSNLGTDAFLLSVTLGGSAVETIRKSFSPCVWQSFLGGESERLTKYFRSFVIARRHGLRLADKESIILYLDYLDELVKLKRDIRNPRYIVPQEGIRQAHSATSAILTAREERRREERLRQAQLEREQRELARIEEDKKAVENYLEWRQPLIGLVISDDRYTAHVLESVDEFFQEGKEMCHCVFASSYYNKSLHPNSIILSVRSKATDERLTTIELNDCTWKIMQNFAKHDSIHKEDADIRTFILSHIKDIKARLTPTNKSQTPRVATA